MEVKDKRRVRAEGLVERPGPDAAGAAVPETAETAQAPEPEVTEAADAEVVADDAEAQRDFLADLQRLQADFDNYRKRVTREREEMLTRASSRVVSRLLGVVDNFERAIAHGEGGEGVALVYKELRAVLEGEGVEEIAAEGQPFDPNFHEAVNAIDDPDVSEPTVRQVFRKGFVQGGHVLRPAMVVVANPVESAAAEPRTEDGDGVS